MKKYLLFLLLIGTLMCSACSENTVHTSVATTVAENTLQPETITVPETTFSHETTAIEALSEDDKLLFDALIKMTVDHFYEPSKIRILEIGDHSDGTIYKKDDLNYGPCTVVVRLQGENVIGGTVNHYYKVCIIGAEVGDANKERVDTLKYLYGNDAYAELLDYEGSPGDYAQLDDDYEFLHIKYNISNTASLFFNIGNINRALKEYWEDLGF